MRGDDPMTPTANGPQTTTTSTPATGPGATTTAASAAGTTGPASATGSPGVGSDTPGAGIAGAAAPGAAPAGGTAGFGASSHVKQHLGEAGDHFRQAARDTGHTLRNAASAAGDELRVGKTRVQADLSDGTLAGLSAAEHARDAAREQGEELMVKGRELIDTAAGLIREKPLASFGAAFAAGWVIAKLARSSK
jgi:ElaB/YqjD/DUF883 family membrane-anchored ribosome-binding protein